MSELLQTKDIARMGNVSERTIRYYDSIGLLKPSGYMENGYRLYSDKDLARLKRIVGLKTLGFSLVEIASLLEKEQTDFKTFVNRQIDILEKRINEYEELLQILHEISIDEDEESSWKVVDELMNMQAHQLEISEHYRSAEYLRVRKVLHDEFGQNKFKWYDWIQMHMRFSGVNRILDVGCGDGALWKDYAQTLRNRDLYLVDKSPGMIEETKRTLDNEYNTFVMDIQNLGFQSKFFDMVVANHVLFYAKDVEESIEEIRRVLGDTGVLYATTYGVNHMRELEQFVQQFEPNIKLSNDRLAARFGLENGKAILSKYFNEVDCIYYEDELRIDNVEILFNYIISSNGNQLQVLKDRMGEFKQFLEEYIERHKVLVVQKQVGMFIAH